jgi:hypothetical protein
MQVSLGGNYCEENDFKVRYTGSDGSVLYTQTFNVKVVILCEPYLWMPNPIPGFLYSQHLAVLNTDMFFPRLAPLIDTYHYLSNPTSGNCLLIRFQLFNSDGTVND